MRRMIAIILSAACLCGVLPFAVFAEGESINLAAGLTYTIITGEPISKTYASYTEDDIQFNKDEGQLTDSMQAELNADSPAWYRAYSGQSRIIDFDLGTSCAVSGIEAGFLHSKADRIYAPRYINVWLSDNGIDYELVAEYSDEAAVYNSETARYDAAIEFKHTYAAQFVRVEFCTDVYTYCDEIEIMGSKTLAGNEYDVDPDVIDDTSGYLGAVADSHDIIKLYNGYYPKDPSVGVLTEFELLPYIAYVDAAGEISGRMFDTIVLSPCDTAYPSGGKLYKADGFDGAVMSDYELYFEHTFTAGQDLDAINKVVGKVNAALNSEEKLNIFLTLPYPTIIDPPFGDINGDGIDEYCRTQEERIAVIKWYADKCISAFEEMDFANLTLAGFYWYSTAVDYAYSDHESALTSAMNNFVHRRGLKTLFTPNYLSTGFDGWASLGFDGAAMQADMISNEMLTEFAQSVYSNHLGAEIQTCTVAELESADSDYLTLGYDYESYMYYGSVTGYINALNIYEQDMGPGTLYNFCYADISTPKGIYLRRLYDLTYRYINGNYINVPPTLTVESEAELIYGDAQITLELGINDIDSHWENISVEFPTMPEHGRVTAAANKKTLIYNVDEDFIGNDSFTVCINDGFNRSDEVTVTVIVSEPEMPEASTDTSVTITPPPVNVRKSTPLWLIILLVVLAAAMVIVAVVTIVKPKKSK